MALHVTPANEHDRDQVAPITEAVQEATGESVELAYVDHGYTGDRVAEAAKRHGIRLEVVKLQDVKQGFVVLPRPWVVERRFGWLGRFRQLAKDYERLAETGRGLHLAVFACVIMGNLVSRAGGSA